VPSERFFARHNFAADIAGRVAQVNVIVVRAAAPSFERLVAHAAHVKSLFEEYRQLHCPQRPSLDTRWEQRIACKIQLARQCTAAHLENIADNSIVISMPCSLFCKQAPKLNTC